MQWNSFGESRHMGGYGLYVWGSYAATFGAMAIEAVLCRKRLRQAREAILQEQQT